MLIINFLFSPLTSQGSAHCQIKHDAGRPELLTLPESTRTKEDPHHFIFYESRFIHVDVRELPEHHFTKF